MHIEHAPAVTQRSTVVARWPATDLNTKPVVAALAARESRHGGGRRRTAGRAVGLVAAHVADTGEILDAGDPLFNPRRHQGASSFPSHFSSTPCASQTSRLAWRFQFAIRAHSRVRQQREGAQPRLYWYRRVENVDIWRTRAGPPIQPNDTVEARLPRCASESSTARSNAVRTTLGKTFQRGPTQKVIREFPGARVKLEAPRCPLNAQMTKRKLRAQVVPWRGSARGTIRWPAKNLGLFSCPSVCERSSDRFQRLSGVDASPFR